MTYRTPNFILQAALSLGRVSFVTVIQTPVVHNTSGEKEKEQGQIQIHYVNPVFNSISTAGCLQNANTVDN